MSVIRSTCDLYMVALDGTEEHAVICVNPRIHDGEQGGIVYGGNLLISSSRGNYSGNWGNLQVPFKEFLLELDLESFKATCDRAKAPNLEQFWSDLWSQFRTNLEREAVWDNLAATVA